MTTETRPSRRAVAFATEALDPLVDLAAEAERAGFARVFTTEFLHRDAVARALAIALGTERIEVATGIAYAFTRLPVAMAALAADVQRLSAGRFALGLGSGTRGVRRWYGSEVDRPAPWLAGYVGDVRRALDGAPGLDKPPPILGAALNPVMARAMARACDGVLLHPLAIVREHLHQRVLPALRFGDGEPAVSAWCITSIAPDEEVAREHARRQAAFYLSTPSYGSVLEGTRWADVAARVRAAFDAPERPGTWAELAPLVPDSLLDEIALAGTPDVVLERTARLEDELADAGVRELVFQTVGAGLVDDEVVRNCGEIMRVLGPGSLTASTQGSP